jgi:cytochrome c553
MKKLILLLIIEIVVTTALVAIAANGPAEIKMETKMGDISFAHAQHQNKISDCTECHHKGTDIPNCTGCHGAKEGVAAAKKAFHDQCKGCHKKSGGPTKCKGCHVK